MSLTVCFSSRAGFAGWRVFALWTPCSVRMEEMAVFPIFTAVSRAVSPDLLMTLVSVSLKFSSLFTICRGFLSIC